uniref:histidine--tRNA ligase n=1 Tax=Spermothamnion repens TaxID=31383 RepID=A0A4D6WXW0_9FLOR|nr:Histidine-tRNA ligase [Spermothamnion repens]
MIQSLRGTKDILPKNIDIWQYIYNVANHILTLYNYNEIRTPILEQTLLFKRSIGENTDIINKEMYSFNDQGGRSITLRPEGTASIVRAFIDNQLYSDKKINRLWYFGPMFRYERPQQGRQRQFHQLGIECIGSHDPIADTEVIRLATEILNTLNYTSYKLHINCIGDYNEREEYKYKLLNYLHKYKQDLDIDSQKRLHTNPIRILDSKSKKTQEILNDGPKLKSCLKINSLKHFNTLCSYLTSMNISYYIDDYLIRGLDYYNTTAFEIKTNSLNQQNTVCGGGRYDTLIQQLGGPDTPSIGWAIGIERLILLIDNNIRNIIKPKPIYLATQGEQAKMKIWQIISLLEKYNVSFELDISNQNFNKQIKKAHILKSKLCLIIGDKEVSENYTTIKWLKTGIQKNIHDTLLENYILYIKNFLNI